MKKISDKEIKDINTILKKIVKNVTLPVAIRLIYSTLHEIFPEKTHEELYEMLLFKTPKSLAFQRSDIYHIHFFKKENLIRVEITLGFLSIYGSSSPLPSHYNERVLENADDTKVLLDFLEMLNHRLKIFIYPIWEKQRYYVSYQKDLSDTFSKYILSILGLFSESKEQTTVLNLHKLLPFSSILSMHQKSTASFLAILKYYFEHQAIHIEEGILTNSYFPESQYLYLGQNNATLGENTCVGTFVLTRHLKYRIHFDDLEWEDLIAFTLKKEKKVELKELVELIQKSPLSYELALSINKDKIKPCILGEEPLYLGSNAWIGETSEKQTIIIEM